MSREDGFVLRFELVACARCGTQRVRGVTCPDCGSKPAGWEVDQHRLDRERQVAGVLEQLDSDPDAPALSSWSLSEEGLFGDFELLLRDLSSSIRELTQPDQRSSRLRELVGEFVELRALVRRVEHRRPFIAQARTAKTATHHIERTIREYVGALTAATPLAAQRHAESFGQVRSLLDLAKDTQDSELEALMRNCMRWLRLQQGDETTLDALRVWTLSDVDWEAP